MVLSPVKFYKYLQKISLKIRPHSVFKIFNVLGILKTDYVKLFFNDPKV